MKEEFRILSATAILGYGFPQESFEEGMKRYCKHCHMTYTSMLAERFLGYKTVFMDETKEQHAREFAKKIVCGE